MPQSELHAYVGNTDCGSNGEGPSIFTGFMNDEATDERLFDADFAKLEEFQAELGLDDTRIAKRYKSAILFVADKPFLAFLHKE